MEPDELYGLPLERFVAERDALTRALRGERRRDEAAKVAALRKPSAAAWAVNQLVRTQRPAVAELFAAGDAVRTAQAELIAGRGDARVLRAAGERERAAVDALVATARGLLDAAGHGISAAVAERVGETLHAAALDERARAQMRDGRLERELRHAGLGFDLGTGAAGRREAAESERVERGSADRERAHRARAERDAAQHERAERERAAARAAELAARRRVERAARALRAAEQRRERAAAALDAADAALMAARAEAAAADDEHRAATRHDRG